MGLYGLWVIYSRSEPLWRKTSTPFSSSLFTPCKFSLPSSEEMTVTGLGLYQLAETYVVPSIPFSTKSKSSDIIIIRQMFSNKQTDILLYYEMVAVC